MVNYKDTLVNLHKKFPDFDLDTLMGIMDEIVEIPQLNLNNSGNWLLNRDSLGNPVPWTTTADKITCTYDAVNR